MPFCFDSSSCVPCSTIRPLSITRIRSASVMLDNRWAMVSTVFPAVSSLSACWMRYSFSGSAYAVASSSTMMGAFFRMARARAILYRSPPDRYVPSVPIFVFSPSGRRSMISLHCARSSARLISSSLASGFPYFRFSCSVVFRR